MNLPHRTFFCAAVVSIGLALFESPARAVDNPPPPLSATELAGRLGALQQDGASYIRLRLEVKQPSGTSVLQLQVKSRSTKTSTDLVYQVLWPNDRKGAAVLLRKTDGRPASGFLFLPPDSMRPLDSSQMKEAFFGSDLSYEDLIENYFTWDHQALVGTEVVGGVTCQILESKPGKNERSSYGSVRTWVDSRRLVPMRIEKYLASGKLARRIDSAKIVTDDRRRSIPASLMVHGSRQDSSTEVDGSRIKHDVAYTDRDFTTEALKEVTTPRSSSE